MNISGKLRSNSTELPAVRRISSTTHVQLLQWLHGKHQQQLSFERAMRLKGYSIKLMGEDGACLFRAVADQLYGDQVIPVIYIMQSTMWEGGNDQLGKKLGVREKMKKGERIKGGKLH